jgi:hypothetical protein
MVGAVEAVEADEAVPAERCQVETSAVRTTSQGLSVETKSGEDGEVMVADALREIPDRGLPGGVDGRGGGGCEGGRGGASRALSG